MSLEKGCIMFSQFYPLFALVYLVIEVTAFAESYPPLNESDAIAHLSKSNACEFAWAWVFTKPINDRQRMLLAPPYGREKPGQLFQAYDGDIYSGRSNYRTEVYCIFNGEYGRGIHKKFGCVAGKYNIDDDTYGELISRRVYSTFFEYSSIIEKPCSKSVVNELLYDTVIKGIGTDAKGAYGVSNQPTSGMPLELRVLVNKQGADVKTKTKDPSAPDQTAK
jgi:hypothetical protein